MANDANMGFEHRFAFGASPHTFGASSTRFEVVSTTGGEQDEILDSAGLLGSRTRREDRSRWGLTRVEKTLEFDVSPRMLNFFLYHILGTVNASDTFQSGDTDIFTPADSLPGFDMLQDPFGTGSNASKFSELYVNRMRLRFGAGLLRMTLETIGKTITTGQSWSGSIPALGSSAAADAPYVFYDCAFNVQGNSQEVEEGELVIDNFLEAKFRNSRTATSIRASDLVVSLVTNIPLTSTIWADDYGDQAAEDATITIDNGTVGTTFTLYNLKAPDQYPSVAGKGEVPLILQSTARSDATDPMISVTSAWD
jgi:hypothetical protein